jgi:hypothetical protein
MAPQPNITQVYKYIDEGFSKISDEFEFVAMCIGIITFLIVILIWCLFIKMDAMKDRLKVLEEALRVAKSGTRNPATTASENESSAPAPSAPPAPAPAPSAPPAPITPSSEPTTVESTTSSTEELYHTITFVVEEFNEQPFEVELNSDNIRANAMLNTECCESVI